MLFPLGFFTPVSRVDHNAGNDLRDIRKAFASPTLDPLQHSMGWETGVAATDETPA